MVFWAGLSSFIDTFGKSDSVMTEVVTFICFVSSGWHLSLPLTLLLEARAQHMRWMDLESLMLKTGVVPGLPSLPPRFQHTPALWGAPAAWLENHSLQPRGLL